MVLVDVKHHKKDRNWETACTHLAVEEPEEADGAQRLYDARVQDQLVVTAQVELYTCLLYTSPSPRDLDRSRMPSSA